MKDIKEIIRILGSDIPGNKNIYYGLKKIKGISYSFSNAICNILDFDKTRKIGTLDEQEIKKIEQLLKDQRNIPSWLKNRRKDYDSGKDEHIIGTDIKFKKDTDIKRMRKIKTYRGMRHSYGLPVRGQRTKAHFRHGATVGVKKAAKMGKTG
jgi:small subunit ribosomal protein S13